MQIFNQKLQPTLYRNRYRLVACDGSVADEVDPELLAKVLANSEMWALHQFTGENDEVMKIVKNSVILVKKQFINDIIYGIKLRIFIVYMDILSPSVN